MLPPVSRRATTVISYTVLWCFGQLVAPLIVFEPVARAATGLAKLEVVESSSPINDSGRFDLKIDSTKFATNVGDGGTTASQMVTGGVSHVVLEQANSTTNTTTLSNYSTSVICKDQHGAGAILGSSSPTGSTSRQLTITTPPDSDVLCTFNNMRQTGSITITNQVVNDNGGSAGQDDFGIALGANVLTSGMPTTVPTGTYNLIEAGIAGYNVTSMSGSGCPTQFGGTITLSKGQAISCVVIHDDQPGELRVVANIVNDNGGSATTDNIQPAINGQTVSLGQYVSVNAGTYTVTQPNLNGYSLGEPNCVDDANQQTLDRPVVVHLAQSVTCALSFDDIAPVVTIQTVTINDNGGTLSAGDFSDNVSSTKATSLVVTGSEQGAIASLNTGAYTIAELPVSGYATTYSLGCSGTLMLSEQRSCIVTNNDIAPELTVTDTVINDDGNTLRAADFLLRVDQTVVMNGATHSYEAGSHVVSIAPVPGYGLTMWSGDCAPDGSITLQVGGQYSCSVTGNDIPATVTLVPTVINDDGGTASAAGAAIVLDDTPIDWSLPTTVKVGAHRVTAIPPSGYTASTWSGDCAPDGTIALMFGQSAACFILFSDIAPSLKIFNQAKPANNQTFDFTSPQLGDFALVGDDTLSGFKVFTNLSAGVYVVNESLRAGWVPPAISCADGASYTVEGSKLTLTLNLADKAMCYFVNAPQPIVTASAAKRHDSTTRLKGRSASLSNGQGVISNCTDNSSPTCSVSLVSTPALKGDKARVLGKIISTAHPTAKTVLIWLPAGLVALALGTALVSWLLARPKLR